MHIYKEQTVYVNKQGIVLKELIKEVEFSKMEYHDKKWKHRYKITRVIEYNETE